MTTHVFTSEEQILFRAVLEKQGIDKQKAVQEIIDRKLDGHAAILTWLQRTGNYDLYLELKNRDISTNT